MKERVSTLRAHMGLSASRTCTLLSDVFPRYRLRGGDVPRGGKPAATGHAGRIPIARLSFMACSFLLFVVAGCLVCPSPALAATSITFSNGHTATLEDDGSITGTATLGEWFDELGEEYPVTMPDGTQTVGICLNYMHYAPAAGTYSFTATPRGNGTYGVTLHTNVAAFNVRQPATSSPLMAPAQNIGSFTWSPKLAGTLKVQKSSSMPQLTDHNRCYALSGAHYGVWRNEACTQRVDNCELVTAQGGTSNEVTLTPGTYWVKETSAPKGYALDTTPHKVTVSGGSQATLSVQDTPLFESPSVWATKVDVEYSSPQGSATFAGAEFTVCYYDGTYNLSTLPAQPTRSWVVRTDDAGRLIPSDSTIVRGSALYRNQNGNVILPLGTITVQETKAPTGYWLEGQDASSPANYAAPVHLTTVNGSGSYSAAVASESVRRAGISLKKVDAETNGGAQGDATLAGITFSIINRNDKPVVVQGHTYSPGETIPDALTTDESGAAQTPSDFLPVGTYEVVESQTNDSMLLTAEPQRITLTDSQTNTLVPLASAMKDEVVRGGVAIGKVSRETGQHLTQGAATLAGAVFSITLDSAQPVYVNGAPHGTGEVVCTLTTDENGLAQTDARALPYGTYTIREVEAPTGFLLNEEWSQTVQIRQDGVIVDLSGEETSVPDQVMRGGFSFNKVDEDTMERMAGIAWRITSVTTGESHVLVSDENGIVDTEANPHDVNTNANDQALSGDAIDEAALDANAGIWFSGRTDLTTTPNNDLSALPYDTYTVEELPTKANEGHRLTSFTVHIHSHNMHAGMGTVDNKPVRIGTTLMYKGEHVAPADKTVELVDVVQYEGLEVGKEYVLEGEIVDAASGKVLVDEKGNPAQVQQPFAPTTQAGTIEVRFEVDASKLADNDIVATEKLLLDGTPLAEHNDLSNENQTIHIPSLQTSLAKASDEEESEDGLVRLVDTVTYTNLVPGIRYEVVGVLMDKQTESPLVNEANNQVSGTTSFVPQDQSGTVEVSFAFDESLVRGKTLVAFETLKRNDVEVAWHRSIDDENQTILFPQVCTELADGNGAHVIPAQGTQELVDTVSYEGLTVGKTYTVEGVLVHKDTGEPVTDADGNEVRSTATIEAAQPSGTVEVTFVVDASSLAGQAIVAFETLSYNEKDLCVHADLNDESQTVYIPKLSTMIARRDGGTEATPGTTTLVDTVSYAGLKPGVPYTIIGTLTDKTTGQPTKNADGSVIVAQQTFTPETSSGTAEVVFEFDASSVAGHSLVAFESLHEGSSADGTEVAQHADINSAEQTESIPAVSTSATNPSTGSKSVPSTGTVRIRDTVRYEGLTPGKTYLMTGSLHDKSTGEDLQKTVGSAAHASRSFVPKEANGTVELEFVVDASKIECGSIVVFESCTTEGHEVATHADKNDENQTITVEASTAKGQKTPSTGDTNSPILAFALALLGASMLLARKLIG